MRRTAVPAVAAAFLIFASCSSAPKPTAEVVTRKNQAAEYSKLGDDFMTKRDYASALRFYEESLRDNRAVDNGEGAIVSLNSIGRVYLAAGKQAEAEATFREALDYAEALNLPAHRALSLANLGEALYARGMQDAALILFQEGLPLAARDERTLAILLHDRAVIYRDQERWEDAETDLRRAAGINQRLKRLSEYGANLYMLGNIASKRGNLRIAQDFVRQALSADKTAENTSGIAADLEALAALALKTEKPEDAFNYYRRAFDVFVSMDSASDALRCALALKNLAGELSREEDETRYAEYAKRIQTAGKETQ